MLAASVISLAGVEPSDAVLWQTEAQVTAQYGEPVDIRRGFDKTKRTFTYQAGELKLEIEFRNGNAQVVRYLHNDETKLFSEGEIDTLLRENSQGDRWRPIDNERWALGVPTTAEASSFHQKQTRYSQDGTTAEAIIHFFEVSTTGAQESWGWLTSWMAKCKRLLTGGERRFVGILELKQEKDERVVAIVRQDNTVLEIPWAWKDYSGKAQLTPGRTYEVTVRQEDPIDLDRTMVFLSDRVHESHGARVVDSDGWYTLVRIREGGAVVVDEAICEVHHTRMEWKKAGVGYGLYGPATKADAICDRTFPHHSDWIRGGCLQGDEKTAYHYLCRECIAGTAKYKLDHPDENRPLYPEAATQGNIH